MEISTILKKKSIFVKVHPAYAAIIFKAFFKTRQRAENKFGKLNQVEKLFRDKNSGAARIKGISAQFDQDYQ